MEHTRCPSCSTTSIVGTNYCPTCGADLRPPESERTTRPIRGAQEQPAGKPAERRRLPSENSDLWLDRVIDGRYRVLSRIGHGGMGVVYKVEHLRMGKIAAMKVLHHDLTDNTDMVMRFRREASAVSRLTHQNSVQVFDFGTAQGSMYLVMEYVRGEDLGHLLKRDGPIEFLKLVPIMTQVCAALAEAHDMGIIHRDLKPENIVVVPTKEGRSHVKVLDFGLAKITEREEVSSATSRNVIVGTPYFMSPEQIRSDSVDARSDIYSLGAVMFRLLTGKYPFTAKTPVGILTKHLSEPLTPPSEKRPDLDIPPEADQLVARAMARDLSQRYTDVDAFRLDLQRAFEQVIGSSPDMRDSGRAPWSDQSPRPSLPVETPSQMVRALNRVTLEQPMLRQDFEDYERSLKRQSRFRGWLLPLVFVAAVAGGALAWQWWRAQPVVTELEPNNSRATASLIAPGRPVRGKIGQRQEPQLGDQDYFRLKRTDHGLAKVHLTLTPIPNMDLAVYLYDASGRLLTHADNAGVGQPETIPNFGTASPLLYVAVQESPRGDAAKLPTENVTDEYELTVRIGAFAPGQEREPNDLHSDATPLSPGSVTGMLGWARDVDRFRWDGPSGIYRMTLEGLDGLPAKVRVNDRPWERREGKVALDPGTVISIERHDAEAAILEGNVPGVDTPYTLTIAATE